MSTVFNFTFVPWFRSVAPYIHMHRGKTFVVGIAGEAIAAGKLQNIVQDLALIQSMGVKIVLVHGFRPQVNEQLLAKGHEPRYSHGMRITDEVWQSQRLNADYILWTASVSKDDDPNSTAKVLGPEVVGKKLTAEVPRWFNLTFRIDCLPAQAGKPERHVLYLGNSLDTAAGNAVSLGNTRAPKDGGDLPSSIEPASLTAALDLIGKSNTKAHAALKARLGL